MGRDYERVTQTGVAKNIKSEVFSFFFLFSQHPIRTHTRESGAVLQICNKRKSLNVDTRTASQWSDEMTAGNIDVDRGSFSKAEPPSSLQVRFKAEHL